MPSRMTSFTGSVSEPTTRQPREQGAEAPLQDRELHVAVGQQRDRPGDGQLDEDRDRERQAVEGEPHRDRPVVEVQAVADQPDQSQGLP